MVAGPQTPQQSALFGLAVSSPLVLLRGPVCVLQNSRPVNNLVAYICINDVKLAALISSLNAIVSRDNPLLVQHITDASQQRRLLCGEALNLRAKKLAGGMTSQVRPVFTPQLQCSHLVHHCTTQPSRNPLHTCSVSFHRTVHSR